MPSFLDVKGTISRTIALIIVAIIVAGLLLAFTSLSVIGYILLAAAATLYFLASFHTLVQQLRQRRA